MTIEKLMCLPTLQMNSKEHAFFNKINELIDAHNKLSNPGKDDDIKCCPFCGEDGRIVYSQQSGEPAICCSNPCCFIAPETNYNPTLKECLEEWNKRV